MNTVVRDTDPKVNTAVQETDPKVNTAVKETDPKVNTVVRETDPKVNTAVLGNSAQFFHYYWGILQNSFTLTEEFCRIISLVWGNSTELFH